MRCTRCADLQATVDIRLPGDLTNVIRNVQAHMRGGTLEELPSGLPSTPPFETLNGHGPWDDLVGHRFRCRFCGGEFNLSVNTYHGSGGSWSRG
jgi:hypothetical protein